MVVSNAFGKRSFHVHFNFATRARVLGRESIVTRISTFIDEMDVGNVGFQRDGATAHIG